MYIKKNIAISAEIILLAIISLIISNFIYPSITLAQNFNSITPIPSASSSLSLPQPPPFSNQLSPQQMVSSTNKTCTLTPSPIEVEGTPQQTEGPYFVAGMPNRSDIRSDPPSYGSIQSGIPLHLVIHIYKINYKSNTNNNTTTTTNSVSCIPMSGAQVDIWHANPQGVYSGIQQLGTEGKSFLRGYQISDNNGTVKFNTVYPGCNQGRAIHIHVMVRTFDGTNETLHWTSQIYSNNSINEQVHTQPPYSKHGPPPITNEQDGIYTGPSTDGLIQSNTGQHLMLNLTKDKQGYTGTFNIVVNASKSGK